MRPSSSLVGAVARRPGLWGATAGVAGRHLPRRWWRGPRALAAARPWLRFRLETAYGPERRQPTAHDLLTWLQWCRAWSRVRR